MFEKTKRYRIVRKNQNSSLRDTPSNLTFAAPTALIIRIPHGDPDKRNYSRKVLLRSLPRLEENRIITRTVPRIITWFRKFNLRSHVQEMHVIIYLLYLKNYIWMLHISRNLLFIAKWQALIYNFLADVNIFSFFKSACW